MTKYQSEERVALKTIRSHRNRRRSWRHMIAVRRAKIRLCGLFLILMDIVLYVSIREISLLFLIAGTVALIAPDWVS